MSLLLGNPELVLLPLMMLTVCRCDHTADGLLQPVMGDTAAAEGVTVVCPPWQQHAAAGVAAALAHMAVS